MIENDAQTVERLTAQPPRAQIIADPDDGRKFLVLPPEYEREEITLPNAVGLLLPNVIVARIALQSVDSLIDYVNRFKGKDTVLFADIEAGSIVAYIDYHSPEDIDYPGSDPAAVDDCDDILSPGRPSYLKHVATLTMRPSIEWNCWKEIDGLLMQQLEFARFVEENAADIRAPDAATILQSVRDFQMHRKVNWTKAVRTASGTEKFYFTEETKATTSDGEVEVPTRFVLGLPVFFGELHAELHAFLRFKQPVDGELKIGIALHRPRHVREAVIRNIVLRVGDRTERPVVFGCSL